MDLSMMSMVNVAFHLMKEKTKEVEFAKLYEEVCEIKGFTEEEADEKISIFYTNISLDGRFITVGENRWDLRERHTFDSVNIDMNDIYADEENEDEENEFDDEEDDGLSAEDSYDDVDE